MPRCLSERVWGFLDRGNSLGRGGFLNDGIEVRLDTLQILDTQGDQGQVIGNVDPASEEIDQGGDPRGERVVMRPFLFRVFQMSQELDHVVVRERVLKREANELV